MHVLSDRAYGGQVSDDAHRKIFVSAAVGMTIAAIATLLRVVLRFKRLWWDDGLALVALLFLAVTAASGGVFYNIKEGSSIPQASRVALYYTISVTFDLTIWVVRLSVMANIIRLGSYQKQLYTAVVFFVIALLVLVAQVFWICEPQDRETHWKSDSIPQCVLGKTVALTQITTDVFADVILVVFPLLILRYMQSQQIRVQKLRLEASFVVGGFTSIVSVVHAIFLFENTHNSIVISNVELSVSVIIANLAVLAAAAHRVWLRYHPPVDPTEHTTMEFERPVQRLTESGETAMNESSSTRSNHERQNVEKSPNDYHC